MKRDEVRRVAREAFAQLIRDVEAGKSDTLRAYLKAMGRFHRYSVGNAILIQLQKPGATHVAGFRAWQRLGRNVRKSEHGIAIMAPVVYRREARTDDSDEDEDAGNEMVTTFKTAYVFDISQTDGKALPEFVRAEEDPGASGKNPWKASWACWPAGSAKGRMPVTVCRPVHRIQPQTSERNIWAPGAVNTGRNCWIRTVQVDIVDAVTIPTSLSDVSQNTHRKVGMFFLIPHSRYPLKKCESSLIDIAMLFMVS